MAMKGIYVGPYMLKEAYDEERGNYYKLYVTPHADSEEQYVDDLDYDDVEDCFNEDEDYVMDKLLELCDDYYL